MFTTGFKFLEECDELLELACYPNAVNFAFLNIFLCAFALLEAARLLLVATKCLLCG
jgi:hypothetical protein